MMPTSNFATKNAQSQYQRWEMGNLSAEHVSVKHRNPPKQELPAALKEVVEEYRKQAFEKGLKEGYAAGMEKARITNEIVEAKLLSIASNFSEALKQADQTMADDVVDLALDIAKYMLKSAVAINPEHIIPVVQHCIHYLPYVEAPARLMLHPEDAEIVRLHLKDELAEHHWQIIEDIQIERGGCMVETASNEIDASNSTRWKKICESLGRDNHWYLEITPTTNHESSS
jgi:flagellar assembly protein FliH